MRKRRPDVEVDDLDRLLELRQVADQVAVGVDDERAAVEDQLVLAADLVDVGDVQWPSSARVATMRSRSRAGRGEYGEALRFTTSSAPPAAWSAIGPVGAHTSSQIATPTFTPAIS